MTKQIESEEEYVASEEEQMMVEEEETEPEAEDEEEEDGDEATKIKLQPNVHPETEVVVGTEATANAKQQEEAGRKELDNESGYPFLFL